MREGIDRLDWMSEATRAAARVKLAKFKPYIGGPEKWRDYSSLTVKRGDDMGNYWRANVFEQERQKAKLGKPVDRDEWTMSPQDGERLLQPAPQQDRLPRRDPAAALLRPQRRRRGQLRRHRRGDRPRDQPRLRRRGRASTTATATSRTGGPRPTTRPSWSRAKALVKQYDAFKPLPDLHVNGELTLGENIGDLSGLTIALSAYQRSLGGKPAPVIGGLTGEQRFFIGFAQIWRAKMRDEYMRVVVVSNEHAPGQYRVNGVVRQHAGVLRGLRRQARRPPLPAAGAAREDLVAEVLSHRSVSSLPRVRRDALRGSWQEASDATHPRAGRRP